MRFDLIGDRLSSDRLSGRAGDAAGCHDRQREGDMMFHRISPYRCRRANGPAARMEQVCAENIKWYPLSGRGRAAGGRPRGQSDCHNFRGASMTGETNRRAFVQVAGLAASGLMAAAGSPAAAQTRAAQRTMGARFRELMNGPEPLICANAYDLLTARLIEVHGFKSVFVGSSATNQELLALPDQAIVTVSEIIDYDCVIAANVNIPVVADVDDFGATPLNVYRFAKQAERGGIACAAFDDRSPLNRAMG